MEPYERIREGVSFILLTARLYTNGHCSLARFFVDAEIIVQTRVNLILNGVNDSESLDITNMLHGYLKR
jgi:hypothetical protein